METDLITISVDGGPSRDVKRHTPLQDVIESDIPSDGLPYLGALVNNVVMGLNTPIESGATIQLLDMKNPHGWLIYRSTVSFIINMAVHQLFPGHHFSVEHSLGAAFFCRFECHPGDIGYEQIDSIDMRMREISNSSLSIDKIKVPFGEAIEEFKQQGQVDKYKLLRFRNPPYIEMNRCDGFFDLAHNVLAANTGDVQIYKCLPHENGLIVQLASPEDAPRLTEFHEQSNLFNIFQEHKSWGRILGVRTAGDLNEVIADGDISEFIRTAEALQEKKIAQLADRIANNGRRSRWIFMAGPSSSGKTTFSKRLAVQLKLNGLKPSMISIDDYFLDREHTPRDEDGNLDFENIEAVDLDFLHEHLSRLSDGQSVQLPRFNFEQGKRDLIEEPFAMDKDGVMIVEGIHGLNPRIWSKLPKNDIFKIYISALTQLNLDFHNRLSTTDNRLVRRLVRDNNFRGNSAVSTLEMWPNVRRGENKWIFPYQEEADAAFNSALDYEIPVLKLFVEPLLLEVKPYHEVYPTAQRIMNILNNFLNIHASMVPNTSILREFIGGSSFKY